jgi:hypothetical protein
MKNLILKLIAILLIPLCIFFPIIFFWHIQTVQLSQLFNHTRENGEMLFTVDNVKILSGGDWIIKSQSENEEGLEVDVISRTQPSIIQSLELVHSKKVSNIISNIKGNAFFEQSSFAKTCGQKQSIYYLDDNLWVGPFTFQNPQMLINPYIKNPKNLCSFAKWSDDGKNLLVVSYDIFNQNVIYGYILDWNANVIKQFQISIPKGNVVDAFWQQDQIFFVGRSSENYKWQSTIYTYKIETGLLTSLFEIEGIIDSISINNTSHELAVIGTQLKYGTDSNNSCFINIYNLETKKLHDKLTQIGYCEKTTKSTDQTRLAFVLLTPIKDTEKFKKELLIWDWESHTLKIWGEIDDILGWANFGNGFIIKKNNLSDGIQIMISS